MADFIDRAALMKELATHFNKMIDGKTLYSPSMALAMRDVRAAPAVDAVEVVRCGECIKPIEDCPFKDFVMKKTDFCSYGERREKDATD